MSIKKALLSMLTISSLCALTGCDYIEKVNSIDQFAKQQALQQSQIDALKKQQEQYKSKIELFEKQQNSIITSTQTLASVVKSVKDKQDEFIFTEFNPAQTQYFILNNGSVGLAGRILSIDAVENGSIIRISLVNLLSVPVSNIGFHATWGNEKPADTKNLAKWQQLLFSTSMNSSLKLLPGQWQDINLTLKGVSPNNLKYLKLVINMANLQFDDLHSAASQQRKSKK
ncbi:DUF3251 domain-containing protein [Escherichia sp. E10V10]|uniref:DUF3251 domain-containing protein n=1 Tax=unclassified Escherichia TaxID=2608889 RepID=UPI001029A7B1|nr:MULTISPECIES: DUF3251 domain-containing protein [unclassified Escherichia]RZM97870.1 DUF3251 domain-containing protein [Escherichia sp. E14V5]RZN01194.1 DUF3251 domain-containing protein [Escherichia sp. E14V7]RZN26134.1 DUF3251 domain-containing protein [Escherichia sp. E14V10]RZN52216.1 DUF3251 domain-containing protein [Escherichia sp. E10V10]TGB56529.1 hypothetical protein CRT22_11915 [Escherichia sp. E5028]